MNEQKSAIRGLEEKKRADTETCRRLLEELGEALIRRIGEDASPPELAAGILAEYRSLQKEIDDSGDTIKSLEADALRLKALDDAIAGKDGESSGLSKEFAEACALLGKALLAAQGLDEFADFFREQEEALLAKIDEQEQKTKDLEEREGGVLAWLGKNAQLAVSRALILKNRSALQKVYRSAGEYFFSARPGEALDTQTAEAARNAEEIKERLAQVSDEISVLRGERRALADAFGAEGSPSRRIQGLQKRIAAIREGFPGIYLSLGSLAAKSEGKIALAAVLSEEDKEVLERAAFHQSMIDEAGLKIEKLKAAISIESEKAEIEKIKKAITHQRHKIADANREISGLERQIEEAQGNIEELQAFLKENE
ncbi:MAG: hypothetical protein FWC64_06125 [Treponema sp.]|nr:hypothetical protein [Treponema sp.]